MNTLLWLFLTLMLLGALTLLMAPRFLLGPSRKPIKSRSSHDFETSEELVTGIEPPDILPQSRNFSHDKLIALVRSPDSLYVYWEAEDWPEGRMLLRLNKLCEYSGEQIILQDIPLYGDTNNWYFRDLTSNTCYWVEIGLLSSEGEYSLLLSSDKVVTPRDTVSSKIDPDWQPLAGLNFGFGLNVEHVSSNSFRKE